MGALHDQEAEEAGRPPGGYAVPARAAAGVLLAAGVGGFLASAVLFAVIPRLEFRQILERFGRARGVVGFSETITLREVTGIKSDPRVVARVEFPELRPGLLPANLYLRGAVYSRYEDGVWRHGGATPLPVQRAGFQHFVGDAAVPDSTADITLEAADYPALFTYGHPTLIEGAFAPVLSDGEGNLSLARSGHPTLRYRVRFAADLPRRPRIERRTGTEDLAFPEGYEDVRVLAQKIAGSAGTDDERAKRIVRFFVSGFRYTLSDPASSIREFLFRKRAGYCEHFAAGLSLLLRGAGIPSRVAAGYLGGEWNGVGKYLIVRQSDAHAWVEAWIDGRWVTLDATPPSGDSSPFKTRTGTIGLYADWLRQRWDKYVVNYSMRMQADAVKEGVRGVRRTGTAFRFRGWDGVAGTARRAFGLGAPRRIGALSALPASTEAAELRGKRIPVRPPAAPRPVRAPRPAPRSKPVPASPGGDPRRDADRRGAVTSRPFGGRRPLPRPVSPGPLRPGAASPGSAGRGVPPGEAAQARDLRRRDDVTHPTYGSDPGVPDRFPRGTHSLRLRSPDAPPLFPRRPATSAGSLPSWLHPGRPQWLPRGAPSSTFPTHIRASSATVDCPFPVNGPVDRTRIGHRPGGPCPCSFAPSPSPCSGSTRFPWKSKPTSPTGCLPTPSWGSPEERSGKATTGSGPPCAIPDSPSPAGRSPSTSRRPICGRTVPFSTCRSPCRSCPRRASCRERRWPGG